MTAHHVFISYSHDSPEHAERVRVLAEQLRADGVDAWIDVWDPHPPEGWPRWMARQIEEAAFVVLVCTRTYLLRFEGRQAPDEGAGVSWEGMLTANELYASHGMNERFVPVLFERDPQLIPAPLRGHTRYFLPDQYTDLLRRLTGQPKAIPPLLGPARSLPPVAPAGGASPAPPEPPLAARLEFGTKLRTFLLSAFSLDELRRFVRWSPELSPLAQELPGGSVSPAAFADALVEGLMARRLLDEALFVRLRQERPRRGAEVDALSASWVAVAGPAAAPAPKRPANLSIGELESGADHAEILHALRLSSGFELMPVQLQGEESHDALLRALERGGWRVQSYAVAEDGWERLDKRLLALSPVERLLVVVWVVEARSTSALRALAALNLAREELIRRLTVPLLWVGREEELLECGQHLPDLWSVRSTVRTIGAPPSPAGPLLPLGLPRGERKDVDALRRQVATAPSPEHEVLAEALAEALLAAGEVPEAAAVAEGLPAGSGRTRVERAVLRARIALHQRERDDAAKARARDALDDADRTLATGRVGAEGSLVGWVRLLRLVLQAGAAPSDSEARAALIALGEVLPAFATGAPAVAGWGLLYRAALRERVADAAGAESDVRAAILTGEQAALPAVEGDARSALALLLRRAGRVGEAEAELRVAAARYRTAGLVLEAHLAEQRATARLPGSSQPGR